MKPWERYAEPAAPAEAAPWEKYGGTERAAPQMSRADFLKREVLRSPPVAIARGLKDLIDTGAEGLAWLHSKATGSQDELERVRGMNKAGKAEFAAATEGQVLPQVARFGGNMVGTVPAANALGAAVGTMAPRLGAAISSGGASGGNLMTRAAGGAAAGGLSAGLVDPSQAGVGAAIGGSLPVVGQVARIGAQAAKQALGATTGVGDEAISQAFAAGREGGARAAQFTGGMRGQTAMDDVLAAAKGNLDVMRQSRQAAYRSGMADVSKDKTVLSLDGIRKAVADAADSLSFNGVSKDPKAAKLVEEARKEVQRWGIKPPATFHTPEGLDALKQRLGSILESIPFEQKNARRAVQGIYDAAKREITTQAPAYAKVMADYSEATKTLSEIERALSLGQRASADTSMRKLQSLMRNNVNTSYGYRDQLARTMAEQGGTDILPALAGQAMNNWAPRGIQRATAGGGAATLGVLGQLPAAAGLAAVSSPRLVGEGAFLAGRASNPLRQLLDPAYIAAPVVGANLMSRD